MKYSLVFNSFNFQFFWINTGPKPRKKERKLHNNGAGSRGSQHIQFSIYLCKL